MVSKKTVTFYAVGGKPVEVSTSDVTLSEEQMEELERLWNEPGPGAVLLERSMRNKRVLCAAVALAFALLLTFAAVVWSLWLSGVLN